MDTTEGGGREPEYGPGAFSIVFPRQPGSPIPDYPAFKRRIHEVVGDPAERRHDIAVAVGRLASPGDQGRVLELIPNKGVTVVDPDNIVEMAPGNVERCGSKKAATLGEIVEALRRPSVNLGGIDLSVPLST